MEINKMRTEQKNKYGVILLLSVFLFSGCSVSPGPTEVIFKPDFAEESSRLAGMSKRFQQSPPQDPTVVESAMEISQKYAKLSEEAAQLRDDNRRLAAANSLLEEKLTSSESRLKRAQKELTEANDLLLQMRVELNNWKSSILGFRDEMRQAEKVQLETLIKILEVLGGEIRTESARDKETNLTGTSAEAG
jgi:chromosome segregation ATPase